MRIYAEIKTIFQGYVIRIRRGARDVSARARLVSGGESGPGAHLMQTFSQSDLSDKFCNGDILHSHHNSITLIRGLLTFCQVAPSLLKPK